MANFLKATSQAYFENVFAGHVFEWEKMSVFPGIVTTDSRIRIFQYKILHNALYLILLFFINSNIIYSNSTSSPVCSFYKCEEETTIHLFHICKNASILDAVTSHVNRHLNLLHRTPQSVIFGFFNISNKIYLIGNHLLILFKSYIYNARNQKHLIFEAIMKNIKNVDDIEKNLADQYPHKKTKFRKKWQYVECAMR